MKFWTIMQGMDVRSLALLLSCLLALSRTAHGQDGDAWLQVINNNNNIEVGQQPREQIDVYRPPSPQLQQQPVGRRRQGIEGPEFTYENQALDAPQQPQRQPPQQPQRIPPQQPQRLPPPPQQPQRLPPPPQQPQRLPPQPQQPQRLPPPPQRRPQRPRPLPGRRPPPPPKSTGILDGIGGAITGAVNEVTCAAQGLYAEDKLKDPAFINYQLQCMLDRGECDDLGKLVKRMAPDILRGGCPPPCDPCKKKQIQKVMATLSRKYPKQFQIMLQKFGK